MSAYVPLWDQPDEEAQQLAGPAPEHTDRAWPAPIYLVVCCDPTWWVRDTFTADRFARKLATKPLAVFRVHCADHDHPIPWAPTFDLEIARRSCRRANREGYTHVETSGSYPTLTDSCGPHAIVDARTMRLVEVVVDSDAPARCPTCHSDTTEAALRASTPGGA